MTNNPMTNAKKMLLRTSVVLAVVGMFLAPGCRVQKDPDGSLRFKSLELNVTELITMALDPDDADKRREGVMGLSQAPWGLQETVRVTDDKGKPKDVEVLKVYHLIASMPHEDTTVRGVAVNA